MSKNHGEIKPSQPPRRKAPVLPRILRTPTFNYNIEHAEAVAKYGLWEMKALQGVRVAGRSVEEGDIFKVPGNTAVQLAWAGDAEFTDRTTREEDELQDNLERLKHVEDPRRHEAFQPMRRRVNLNPETDASAA